MEHNNMANMKENDKNHKKCMNMTNHVVIQQVMSFIRDIDYGEIVVTIHNSKVVQIEQRVKTRFKD